MTIPISQKQLAGCIADCGSCRHLSEAQTVALVAHTIVTCAAAKGALDPHDCPNLRESDAPRAARRALSLSMAALVAATPLTFLKCSKGTAAPTSSLSSPGRVFISLSKLPCQCGLYQSAVQFGFQSAVRSKLNTCFARVGHTASRRRQGPNPHVSHLALQQRANWYRASVACDKKAAERTRAWPQTPSWG